MVCVNECIDVNTALKNFFKSVSCSCRIHRFKKFPMLARPKLYLDILFQIYGSATVPNKCRIWSNYDFRELRARPIKLIRVGGGGGGLAPNSQTVRSLLRTPLGPVS
jgi:hypothetical protein